MVAATPAFIPRLFERPSGVSSKHEKTRVDDEHVKECLRRAGLGKFIEGDYALGLGMRHLEWNDVLSGGERERID